MFLKFWLRNAWNVLNNVDLCDRNKEKSSCDYFGEKNYLWKIESSKKIKVKLGYGYVRGKRGGGGGEVKFKKRMWLTNEVGIRNNFKS